MQATYECKILTYMQNTFKFGDPYPLGILSPVEPELFWRVYPLGIKSPGDQTQNIWNSNSQLGFVPQAAHVSSLYR